MIINNLTLKNLYKKEQANPTGKRFEITYGGGLGLRVSKKGKFTWQCRYRFGGKQHRLDIGRYPELSISEAVNELESIQDKLKNDIDPLQDDNSFEINTVSELCEYWVENYASRERRRPEIAIRSINADIDPVIGNRNVRSIQALDIHRCLTKIVKRGSKTQAHKTLSLLKQIFSYGVVLGVVNYDPAASISRNDVCKPSKRTNRKLDDDEIVKLMGKLNDHSIISEQFSIALKILLHTGQRRGEIINAQWQEVDLAQGSWYIPAAKNKAGRDHIVYLTSTVVQFFKRLKALSYGSEWVIPSKSCSEKPFSERALTRAVNRAQEQFGLKKWVPHDLRRTFVSGVNGIGGEIHVTEKIVNHALEGMLKVYDVGDYDEQKKKTMLMWESHLNTLCKDAEISSTEEAGV